MLLTTIYRPDPEPAPWLVAAAPFSPLASLQWVMLNPQPLPPRVLSIF